MPPFPLEGLLKELLKDFPKDLLTKEILTKLPLEECFQLLAYYGLSICTINPPHRAGFVIKIIHSLFDNDDNAWQHRIQNHFPQFNIIPLQKIKETDWQKEYFNHLKKKRWVDVFLKPKTDRFYNITAYNITVNILNNNQLPELSSIKKFQDLVFTTEADISVSANDLFFMVSTQELLNQFYEETSRDFEEVPTENKAATLHPFAVCFNQVELLKENIPGPSESALMMNGAAQYGYTKIVELLLQTLPTPTKDFFGTSLHLACFFGHQEIITLLMEKGADPLLLAEISSHISLYPERYTPIQCAVLCAAYFKDLTPLKILAKHRVNMKTVYDIHGSLLSFYLAHAKPYQPSVIKLLLKNGAPIEEKIVSDVVKNMDRKLLALFFQHSDKDLMGKKVLDKIQWAAQTLSLSNLQDVLAPKKMNTHSFKLLYTGGLALNWDDPRSQPSPAHEKLLGYALITRDAKSPKESALNLLKDAKSTSHLLSHSHFFTTPIDTLIKNIGSIEKSEDCDAIKLAFSPYIHQQNPNKEEQEIKEIYEFLCEFTFVPKIDKTSVDVKYSLNL